MFNNKKKCITICMYRPCKEILMFQTCISSLNVLRIYTIFIIVITFWLVNMLVLLYIIVLVHLKKHNL